MLNKNDVKIIQGDFSKDSTYSNAGVRFEDISSAFNYIDNYEQIAAKIADRSPPGTVFLFNSIGSEPTKFEGLICERSLRLFSRHYSGGDWGTLHVYRKQ